jgi:peptidoglycan/xylan/chitin deacetylase (PgdA/CDA1 family)
MSRFHWLTIVVIGVLLAVPMMSSGASRWQLWAVTVIGYALVSGLGVAFLSMELFVPAWCHGDRSSNRVALTFDDGPDVRATPALLELLGRRKVPATFLCIGERVEQLAQLVRRINADGHEIGNHSHRHRWWINFLVSRPLRYEMQRCQRAIHLATGVRPRFYRPPVGLTNPHTRAAIEAVGLRVIGWDVRSLDRGRAADVVIRRVVRSLRPGSVVLLHDGGAEPDRLCAIVDAIIDAALERDFVLSTVSRLMHDS